MVIEIMLNFAHILDGLFLSNQAEQYLTQDQEVISLIIKLFNYSYYILPLVNPHESV